MNIEKELRQLQDIPMRMFNVGCMVEYMNYMPRKLSEILRWKGDNIPCKYSFTDFMRNMCGDEFMITGIEGQRLLGYPMGAISVSIDMVEPVPEDEIDGAELDDFLSGIKINS